jgi:hypothetical protein
MATYLVSIHLAFWIEAHSASIAREDFFFFPLWHSSICKFVLVQFRHSLYALLLNAWLSQDYEHLPIISSLIIGVCKEKTQSAASRLITYVLFLRSDTGKRSVFHSRSSVRGLTFEDVIRLSDTLWSASRYYNHAYWGRKIVCITWWKTAVQHQLRVLVMGVANDNGQTFGSLVMLSAIGTVSSDCWYCYY